MLFADGDMVQRGEAERLDVAVGADEVVVVGALAHGHGVVAEVGDAEEQRRDGLFDEALLLFERLAAVGHLFEGCAERVELG